MTFSCPAIPQGMTRNSGGRMPFDENYSPLDCTEPCNAGELSAEPWKRKTPYRISLSHCSYQNNPKASLHGTTGHLPNPSLSGPATAVTSPGCWGLTRTHFTPHLFSTAMQKFTLHSRNPFRGIIFLLISKKNNGMYSKFFLWWPTINHFIAQVTSSMGRKMSCHH